MLLHFVLFLRAQVECSNSNIYVHSFRQDEEGENHTKMSSAAWLGCRESNQVLRRASSECRKTQGSRQIVEAFARIDSRCKVCIASGKQTVCAFIGDAVVPGAIAWVRQCWILLNVEQQLSLISKYLKIDKFHVMPEGNSACLPLEFNFLLL